jgi:trans-feruloyl-CoA hydratase/vanillin synthase
MNDYEYSSVKVEFGDGIAWLTMNRPDKRNAMSPQLHYEMDDALDKLETDPAARAIILSGAGGNFSAGQDMKTFFREYDDRPLERRRITRVANRWRWQRLYEFDKPTIAMVEGYCVGGAFMQLVACDFAIAADDAQFSISEINWGIIPGGLVAKAVVDTILPRHAMYYCCFGEPFDGKEAARIGLINFAFPKEKLREAAVDMAKRLMLKSPATLRATKQAVRHVRTMDHAQSYEYLAVKDDSAMVGDKEDSYNAGLSQFIEKTYKPVLEPFKLRDAQKKEAEL